MWASRSLIRQCTSSLSSSISLPLLALASSCPYTITGPSSSTTPAYRLLQYRCVIYNKITKNKLLLNKQRDSSYENFMDDEKKMNLLRRIIKLLLKQPEQKLLYRFMLRRGGYVGLVKPQKMGDILQKYPRIVRVYRNPNELDVWVTLAKPILQLLEKEKTMKQEMAYSAAERLRKVLMLSTTRRIRLDRIHYLKEELGLPDDFKKTVIRANPHLFKLVISRVDLHKGISPSVKLLDWDDKLAVPVIEEYREDPATVSGLNEEEKKKKEYSFPINLPPGFKIKKAFRIKLRKWQELPYRSPYADTSDLDMNSDEAVKRAVAVIHEFLHITVEKRTQISHLAHLRADYKLPQKLGVTVLQNPGIFYLSTKCNTQTIFLREGYKQGNLVNKEPLFSIKKEFMALIKMGRKSLKKPKGGRAEISDSDTSDEETERVTFPEEMRTGNDKEGMEMNCLGIGEDTDEERGQPNDSDLDANDSDLDAQSEKDEEGTESEELVCTLDGPDDEREERDDIDLCTNDGTDDEREEGDDSDLDDPIYDEKSDGIHGRGDGCHRHKDSSCEDENEYEGNKDADNEEDYVDEDEDDHVFQEQKEGSRENLFETEDDSSDSKPGHNYGKARARSRDLSFARRARC